jgi:S-(hydroxymethyl)glutathione dehydrogenase/alcohol dehydrogenase
MNFNAAVLISTKKVVIDRLEMPKLCYGQVLVKVLYSSICQTQIGEIFGTRGKDYYLPHCLGHEAVGIVADKHKSVLKVKVGNKVCLSWIKGSGIDSGGTKYRNNKNIIINAGPVNTFSEYSVVSENRIYKLSHKDNTISSVLLGCAIPTAFNSVFNSLKDIKNGPIYIFGCGGVGLSTIIASKTKKIRPIIGIDINSKKLEIAKAIGADKVFNFNKKGFNKELMNFSNSNFPTMIECTGNTKVLNYCIEKANTFGGKILVIGNYHKPSFIKLDPWNIIAGKTLLGAWNDLDVFDNKFRLYKSKISKNYSKYFFGNKVYNLNEINKAIKDFKIGKVIRPLIMF